MTRSERRYVSKLVPTNLSLLKPLLIAVAVVNSATLGYDSSVMSGLLILPSYTDYFQLTTATTGINNAASWIGSIFGTLAMQPIADGLGRRRSILVACIITAIGIILQAAAQNIGMFIVARIIVGIGCAINNGSAPTLLGELLLARTRGRILGIFFSCYYVGSLLSSIINYGSENIQSTWAWRLPSLLQIIPSLLALFLLPFVPESPRWLIFKGQYDHAQEVLLIMQGEDAGNLDSAAEEMHEINLIMAKEEEKFPRNPWRELVSTPANRKRLLVLATFGTMINTLGNFVASWYLASLLDQAGLTDTTKQLQVSVGLNCWCFVVAIIGSCTLDIFGRRLQTLTCLVSMVVTLYIVGGLIKTYGASDNNSGMYGTIAVIFLFQGFYSFSITPMTSLYPTEISQYKLRSAGIAIFRIMDSAFGLLFSFTMSFAMADLSWKFYLINASWDIVFALIFFFYFPETKGLKLEEIAIFFEGPQIIEEALATDCSSQADAPTEKAELKITA